jgi:hypothetical protein
MDKGETKMNTGIRLLCSFSYQGKIIIQFLKKLRIGIGVF